MPREIWSKKMAMKFEFAIIRQLPYFVAVAEELNLQRASERLNIAPSALSRRVRDLEHDLGDIPLFVRLARGVRLTSSGETLLEDAREILALVEKAGRRVRHAAHGESGHLRIAYSAGAIRNTLLADILKAVVGEFPYVETEASMAPLEDIVIGIRDSSFLAGLLYIDEVDPAFASMDIAEEEFYLALPAGHRLAQAETIVLADLLDETFIWYSPLHGSPIRRRLSRELERRGVTLRIEIESPNSEATLGFVSKGMGLGFAPLSAYRTHAFPGITLRRIEDLRFSGQFKMLWLAGNPSPILSRLVETVTNVAKHAAKPSGETFAAQG
jgi:DNA-binding transcriptional LysR family regulator